MRSASGKRILTFKLTREHAEAISSRLDVEWPTVLVVAAQAFNAQLERQKAKGEKADGR